MHINLYMCVLHHFYILCCVVKAASIVGDCARSFVRLRIVQPFRSFLSQLHIAHGNHSRNYSIGTVESPVSPNAVHHMRLHQSNNDVIECSVQCVIETRNFETTAQNSSLT